ncbi:hypothetical protein DL98DRAFT_578190 [Cadophora sp. DSE1049]|nr:hypothetical protein DL98DRAFT_578190 [Cadophora sp. DSE1049]
MASPEPYLLYYNKWSICSQMVQLTLAFKGEPKDDVSSMVVEQKEIDIIKSEQLEEAYLTEINPKGQVPVLTHPSKLPKPISDSLDITHFITSNYPSLLPENRMDEIIKLLKELHAINYFSLSFGNKPAAAKAQEVAVDKKIAEPSISERYRKALVFKLKIVQNEKVNGVTDDEIEAQVENTKTFLEKIADFYEPGNGPWLWGQTRPTAIDVQVAVFIARLHDVGRGALVPDKLAHLREHMIGTNEWQELYQGRSTMFGVAGPRER